MEGDRKGGVGMGGEGKGGDGKGRDGREGDGRGVLWSPKQILKIDCGITAQYVMPCTALFR